MYISILAVSFFFATIRFMYVSLAKRGLVVLNILFLDEIQLTLSKVTENQIKNPPKKIALPRAR